MNTDLDLRKLIGSDYATAATDAAIDSLLISMENFKSDTTVKGTGNIFDCAISLGDFDFSLNLDFFDITPTKMDYILLKKIQYLRRLIVDINNIFINIIQDLECCTGDDRYNKTVVPIFKWLVEDSNGLCGTLLKISKDINKIYMPLKRVLCLFRNVPGNPTWGSGGTDFLRYIYPISEGLERVTNMLDNGRFLDLIIIPVKDFHDKLVACHNGTEADFYTGYASLKDLISASIYNELTTNMIDEIKSTKGENLSSASNAPVAPIPPEVNYSIKSPKMQDFDDYDSFSKAMFEWNIGYSEYRKELEREYNDSYSEYLIELDKYKQKKFESTLNINDEKFENTSFAVELSTDTFKTNHRAICGCLGELFKLDGYFIPKDYIIRNESDLNGLIGEVEYRGVSSSDYYINEDEKKIKIINSVLINDIRNREFTTSFSETMKYPIVKDEFLQEIAQNKTINDILNLNIKYTNKLNKLQQDFRKATNYYDSLGSSFYSIYLSELEDIRRQLSLVKSGSSNADYDTLSKKAYSYAEYPPSSWISEDKNLTSSYQNIFGNITYKEYLKGIDDMDGLVVEINEYKEAIGRNYGVFKIVDESIIECGCDLLCMVIKYIIGLIMDLIKKLITYITKFITMSIINKELQWWIKFVMDKIKCIIDILNLSKDLKNMEKAFNDEMKRGEGSIRKAPESVSNCTTSTKSVIDEINLYPEKSKVQPDTIKDINWVPSIYPEYDDPYVDVTPVLDDSFKLITDKVEFQTTGWKNRTIPTMILNCQEDFSAAVDWIPSTNSWKAFLNIELNINQFNNGPSIVLEGNKSLSEEVIISNMYQSILYKILEQALDLENFKFKINLETERLFITSGIDNYSLTSETLVINNTNELNNINCLLSDIDKVWFWVDAYNDKGEDISTYVKVFDRNQAKVLKDFKKDLSSQLEETLDNLRKTSFDTKVEPATSSKICGANSLSVTYFQPVFNDKNSMLFPGKVEKVTSENGTVNFIYTPKTNTNDDGIESKWTKNNTPFKLTMTNGSGTEFTVVLLIDVCDPGAVQNSTYSKDVDGVFLNGRYDYIEFIAIPNDVEYIISEKNIIKNLRGYLENVGAISSAYTGPLGIDATQENTMETVKNITKTINYSDDFDPSKINASVGLDVINNLPTGVTKASILAFEKLNENITTSLTDLQALEDLAKEFDVGIKTLEITPEGIVKTIQRLGIPLMVLNEDSNIILTIHDKKLKLLNINSDFGLDVVLETSEIDYVDGEQLFVEFSTTGFEHTISWINERKVKNTASIMSLNSLELKPTQLGSFYKNGEKVALMCGKINDIIFTNSNRTADEWFNNSNTYRPGGTIGFYDFSLFDGYNVYSIPEFFKVVKLNSLATVKGILYESKEYTSTEIAQKLQEGKYNELLSKEVTLVGERPISVGGDFIWKNNVYYKNVSFGYLENFFCRDNLSGESFTISFWLKQKDAVTNDREDFAKKYIFSDTHNGNFIWIEEDLIHIKLADQPIRIEPVKLMFIKDIFSATPEYVEKWFHHVFKYDKSTASVNYSITPIDQKRNFDSNYSATILDPINIKIPLKNIPGKGRILNFSLVTMLARYDVKRLDYTDNFYGEITALAIWNSLMTPEYLNGLYNYQRRIIINEM